MFLSLELDNAMAFYLEFRLVLYMKIYGTAICSGRTSGGSI